MKIQHKKTDKKKIILIVIAIIIAIAAIGGAYYYYTSVQPQQNKAKYGSESTKPTADQPKSTATQEGGSAAIGSSKDEPTAAPTPASTVTPAVPIGVFVSNHSPNLSGSPAPNTMNSTCTTTAGVSCTIEFRQGATVKQLEAKQTDSNGNATWNWKLQDIGLSEGTWSVTAIAKNGSLTASSKDPADLEVGR